MRGDDDGGKHLTPIRRQCPIAKRATALIPNSRLAIAPGSGHRVPWEAEEWLAEKTSSFLWEC